MGNAAIAGLREVFRRRKMKAIVQGFGPMFQIYFTERDAIHDYRDYCTYVDTHLYSRFVHRLLERGIYMTPSNGLHWIISTAHTEKDVATLIEAADRPVRNSHEGRRHESQKRRTSPRKSRREPPSQLSRNTSVFLGGGRITGALLAGLRPGRILNNPSLCTTVIPRNCGDCTRNTGWLSNVIFVRAVEQADLLIIAVRPDAVRELLQKIKASDPERINPGKTDQLTW